MSLLHSRVPLELGRREDVDPYAIEPGVILWERFCVVGPVRHTGQVWRVLVTDVRRELGVAPHHRLEVHVLRLPADGRERVRRAALADHDVQPAIRAMVELDQGLTLIFDPPSNLPVFEILDERDAERVTEALTRVLARLHGNGVCGVEFRLEDLRRRGSAVVVAGFDHLLCGASIEQDLAALTGLLSGLGGARVGALLSPAPRTAAELAQRAQSLFGPTPRVEPGLSSQLPFVGRGELVSRLQRASAEASIARASVILLRGERGVGKSRVLEQLLDELRAAGECLVVADQGVPRARRGLVGSLHALASQAAGLSARQREAMRTRIEDRIAPFQAVLGRYAPRLVDLVGSGTTLPPVELEEAFVRDVGVVADTLRAVGTQAKPLVLVFEDLHSADAATLAVIRRVATEERTHHTLVLATVRGEIPAALADAPIDVLDLQPFDAETITDAVQAYLPGRLAQPRAVGQALAQATAGYPLAVWVQLGTWLSSGQLERDDEDCWHLHAAPPSAPLIELIDHRIVTLDERAHAIAILGAAAGPVLEAGWLTSVVGEDVVPWLDALVRAGLVIRTVGGEYRFSHGSVRERMLACSDPEQLRRAHATIAHSLQSAGVSACAIAYHREHGRAFDEPRDPALGKLHVQAGRESLAVYDLDRAAWHFERALECPLGAQDLGAARHGRADALVLGGHTTAAAAGYIDAIEQAEDPLFAVALGAKALYVLYVRGDAEASLQVAQAALRRVGHRLPRGTPAHIAGALAGSVVGRVRESDELRDALCRLYFLLINVLVARDKPAIFALTLRAYRLAKGLETPAAATILAMWGAAQASLGRMPAAERVFEDAQRIVDASADDWRAAMLRHLRAHLVTLPVGRYREGQRQLDEAVARFRRAGDLAPAALALFFKAAYGLNREPAEVLLAWSNEAISVGGRHGLRIAVAESRALRLVVLARLGAPEVPGEAVKLTAELDASPGLEADEFLARAYVIIAAVTAGELDFAAARARELAGRARAVDRMPELFQIVHVAIAWGLSARPGTSRSDRKALAAAMAHVHKAGRHSPRMAAAEQFLQFRSALVDRDLARARARASGLIGTAAGHGEAYLALEVMRGLEGFEQASQPAQASLRRHEVKLLAKRLGLVDTGARVLTRMALPPPRPREEQVFERSCDLQRSIEEVVGAFVFPFPVQVEGCPELSVSHDAASLRSFLTMLVLAARDARSGVDEMLIRASGGDGEPGTAWAVVEVTARGPGGRTIAMGGLSGCRQMAARLDTEIEASSTELETRIVARLPARAVARAYARAQSRECVVIVHPDPRVRKTLVATLSRAGLECRDFAPDDSIGAAIEGADFVFADAEFLRREASLGAGQRAVEIVKRGREPATEGRVVRVPVVVDELDDLLEGLRAATTSIGAR